MASVAESLELLTGPANKPLGDDVPARIDAAVHDASRLGWLVTIPLPGSRRTRYSFEVELEVPTHLVGLIDPWASLQFHARLDGSDDPPLAQQRSVEAFRRSVVATSSRLARARDGFLRHCTLLRSDAVGEDHWRPLALWVRAASAELASARSQLCTPALRDERGLAEEFLSGQLWTVLTDCTRALFDVRRAMEEREAADPACFDAVEEALADSLREEIAHRHQVGLPLAEPTNTAQLERLFSRMQWLKRHFERVLYLEVESYQVLSRLSGWFSALAAALAYLWLLLWQLTLERHPVAVGSGVVAFALITAVAYASRERLKEVGRSWLAGRVQRMYAQRVTRCRIPRDRQLGGGHVVVSARESFSQSSAQRFDPAEGSQGATRDVTLLRFVHRAHVGTAPAAQGLAARYVRFIYRFDLSALLPRLHDAVRGFASFDPRTQRITIVDVPRNYRLALRTKVHWDGEGSSSAESVVVLNKNGLLRLEASARGR